MKMRCSLEGLLLNAAEDLTDPDGTSEGGRAFGLQQLLDHLQQVRAAHRRGKGAEILSEFFDLYTLPPDPELVVKAAEAFLDKSMPDFDEQVALAEAVDAYRRKS